ncbi:MAG TPA: homocysteine S-methyltransferase family protein, partial [Tepidiformaceae bacterium]|nr:homocysteine S-methyltransferase family protein [Tepidiformaceae bacterium]
MLVLHQGLARFLADRGRQELVHVAGVDRFKHAQKPIVRPEVLTLEFASGLLAGLVVGCVPVLLEARIIPVFRQQTRDIDGSDERGYGNLPLPVDLYVEYVAVRGLEFEPCAPVRDEFGAATRAETNLDTLNVKAAIVAFEEAFAEVSYRVPVSISVTITDASGRTLSGQTAEAFFNSVRHANPLSIGINCALGAKDMKPHLMALSRVSDVLISCYPNAGLPNAFGGYDETPAMFAADLAVFAKEGLLNIAGGCCGTSPEHIKEMVKRVATEKPRRVAGLDAQQGLHLAGLEPLNVDPSTSLRAGSSTFLMIGERTNVTGSPKFKKLIIENKFEEALEVARQQVEAGANIIDVNFDEALLDGEACMTRFLNLIAS